MRDFTIKLMKLNEKIKRLELERNKFYKKCSKRVVINNTKI